MKLIKNKILINLKNSKNEYLLVNILFGLVDLLTEDEANIIKKWMNLDNIFPTNATEQELYNSLNARFYFLSEPEENKLRDKIISMQVQSPSVKLIASKSASFIFSYACNFKCPYCFEGNRTQNRNIMTIDMIDKVLSLYPDGINHIGFFGGEPLLPQNKHLIMHIINKVPSAYYTIITNGYYLDQFIPIIKSIQVAMVQVTLDGCEQQHNKTRTLKNGKPTYQKIISNIQLCIENEIPVKIRMNLTRDNIDDCHNERQNLLSKLGNKYLSFELQPLFEYSYQEQATFFHEMLSKDKLANSINRIWNTLPRLSNFIFNNGKLYPLIRFCESEAQNRFYDCDGNIYSCILSVGEEKKSIGHYYPSLQLKDKSLLTYNITKNPTCKKCNLALICGGGCPYHIMDSNGNINSTNCSNLKNEIDNLIPALYKAKYGE